MNSGFDWSADAYGQALADHDRSETGQHQHNDQHLRSCNAVMKYHIHATDGDIGHVHGLLIDDETWAIRYLIVDTSNWWLGHQVLIAPQWIDDVSWFDCKASVDLTRQAIKESPPYDAAASPDWEQETDIHRHYARAGYWAGEAESGAERPRI